MIETEITITNALLTNVFVIMWRYYVLEDPAFERWMKEMIPGGYPLN
ncbi:hypothetical protein [Methanogenium cariaci]|nr:hypothetical protein [Methanogenium cariaci]